MSSKIDNSAIFFRVGVLIGSSRDKDIAAELGLKPNAYSQQKRRNTIKLDPLMEICDKYGVSIQWLLTGQEDKNDSKLQMEIARLDSYTKRLEAQLDRQEREIKRLEAQLDFTDEDEEPLINQK